MFGLYFVNGEREGRMTVSTATPFVNTPFGVGVVEISGCRGLIQAFVRFQDGTRRWVPVGDCEPNASRPYWYREPETALIAGWVG